MTPSVLSGREPGVQALVRSSRDSAVLLAVGDPKLHADLQAMLHGWGHPFESAVDGNALLRALECPESLPIVILDADLPGLRGIPLLNQLQLQAARPKRWAILLAPAAEMLDSDDKATGNAGIDDILAKPVDEFELRVSLRAAARIQARYAEMVEAIDAARFDASHDSLTGLLNRELLLKVLFQETDRAQRLGSQLTFLLLDLDQFSRVNREHGYDGGDRVLRQLASRFRRFLRSYDVAGRCGADQFLIAMPGCTQDDARSMAARLRDCVSERPFDILQASVAMTASIGISQSGGRSPLAVLREAEYALSRAKLTGGACARWFHSSPTNSEVAAKSATLAPNKADARSVPV